MGILLEGFAPFSLADCSIIVMVAISNCIWVAMGLLYMFSKYLLVNVYLLKPRSWAYFFGIGIEDLVMGWTLCQDVCFRVVGDTLSLHFHWNFYKLVQPKKGMRVMHLCVLDICNCLVSNCFSYASLPTLPSVELSHYYTNQELLKKIVVPQCLLQGVSAYC
jgi:hypothetical protein